MNNSPVKSELYVALEMVELTQFLPFTFFLNSENLPKIILIKKLCDLFQIEKVVLTVFYMSSIYLFQGTSVEWCWGGERGRGGTGGSSPCSEALLRAVAELLAWIEARPWRQAAAEKFCSVLPFLPPQKTPHLHSLSLFFYFLYPLNY